MKLSALFVAAGAWLALSAAPNPDLLTKAWKARWITAGGAPVRDYGVYHFRRTFTLDSAPARFLVHVSGDNRYQLYANGARVAWGPARGDLYHWRYESVDIAPQLRAGRNVLAAVVWNDGPNAAVAQISNQTAFVLQGDSDVEQVANSGAEWRAVQDAAYSPRLLTSDQRTGYHALGPTEQVDGAKYPWGWEQAGFDDSSWPAAAAISPAYPREAQDAPNRWMLVPRPIPMMEETPQRLARLRKAEGIAAPGGGFPARQQAFTVPANATARMILDQDHLTTAFPELVISGGRGARITLKYAEGLWEPGKRQKGDREVVEGKEFFGYSDLFIADGGAQRLYRPLFWRTFRYLELSVATGAEAVRVEDLRSVYTGYPFERRAQLDAGKPELDRMLEIGWRTARLCAHETYMDCPYYEQLQYGGDTRLQGLVSIYMTGDARLLRNAIELLNASRTPEGATYSRAPSALQQYIPGFSLWWIGMLHDYWWYAPADPQFVREMLPGVRAVISFFEARRQASGLLGRLPWWPYVDWTPQWPSGVPPKGPQGEDALNDLQLTLAYGWAADLEEALGNKLLAGEDREKAAALRSLIRSKYWDELKGLYSDTTERGLFSQQTNTLAVLAGVAEGTQAREVMERAVKGGSMVQASTYFRSYLLEAMNKAGLGDRYLDLLDPWRKMLAMNLTTWAEALSFDRSDCHAWGASPNFELFRTVLGVDSAAPGFAKVIIRPHLGALTEISGTVPHPKGLIKVSLKRAGADWKADITLPPGVEGELDWGPASRKLR
jgi:alpha-L-rhamnosidase